jgi:hypothetical protein
MDSHDVESHLRAASDAIMLLLGEVEQLEAHKRGLEPGDPRFTQLAVAVRTTAETLAALTREQEAWGKSAPLEQLDVAPISKSRSDPPLPQLLERWREVERRLTAADPGSPEAVELFEQFERIRNEYLAAFRARESSS